ncbi:MAG: TonB-dependent receptor [Gammaproteobacteria bacterium]
MRLLAIIASFVVAAPTAWSQTTEEQDQDEEQGLEQEIEELVVTGTRQVLQSTIAIKRDATEVVDGLSAADIGEIPALSIGEALETITGAASHRENGGATEISIRGMGPYLSTTVFNGREATNGSGDRSVNFSQFPSELMNKLAIYKTQNAALIEGGISGQIQLETVKPLDFGKQRIQLDVKGNYNPDQQKIDDSMAGDYGYRITTSYVDQFEVGGDSNIGVAVGVQTSYISQPEQEIRSSSPTGSSLWACLLNGTGDNADQGFTEDASRDDDCEDDNAAGGSNDGYDTAIDPNTGLAVDAGQEYIWAMSQRIYRQNDTLDTRDAVFGAFQYQPNNKWDINVDMQWSVRTQNEDRYDLSFDNSRRNSRSLTIDGYTSTVDSLLHDGNGEALRIAYETEIASGGEIYERKEEYLGFGIDVEYHFSDNFRLSADWSSSETKRTEEQFIVRLQSGGRVETVYSIASGIPQYRVLDFDITDITNFDDDIRLRVDNDVDRTNTVDAYRVDGEYSFDNSWVRAIDFGVRSSELGYVNLGAARNTFTLADVSSSEDHGVYACARSFPESDFLGSVSDGALVTNVDVDGNVLGSSNGWAIFDNQCLSEVIAAAHADGSLAYPALPDNDAEVTDVTETTFAAYAKLDFGFNLGSLPVHGNFGVRLVDTEVESVGYRSTYTVVTAADGTLTLESDSDILERAVGGTDYSEMLPSFNFVLDVHNDMLVRGGIFRGMTRVDPADMSYNRTFTASTDNTDPQTLEDLLVVSGSGNPSYKPLLSWNLDASFEWYRSDDSLLAVGIFYKEFNGGFENAEVEETFVIDGESVVLPLVINSTNENESTITGIEFTYTDRFSGLPGALSGLGVKFSYSFADSNFEFQDSNYGVKGIRNLDGTFTATSVALVSPANLPGLSKQVLSAQLYWQWRGVDLSLYYKSRDEYFQPYTSNGTRIRYVGANEVWEFRASYRINRNVKLRFEGLNLFDEPRIDTFYQDNHFGQQSVYGQRYFMGVTARF